MICDDDDDVFESTSKLCDEDNGAVKFDNEVSVVADGEEKNSFTADLTAV